MKHYDYIILGAGAAGLQLAYYMALDDFYRKKSILIIEKSKKDKNDRTWCFWEEGYGDFDNIVYKNWGAAFVNDSHSKNLLQLHPFQYKMIKGIDFYNYILGVLKTYKNITFIKEEILSYNDNGLVVTVNTASKTYEADKGFNSIFHAEDLQTQDTYPVLKQHFRGWFVETESPVFKADKLTFMDFSIPQEGNTRFMYVLPLSDTEALFEYTLFSENLLVPEIYEEAIKSYIEELGITNYKIIDKEKGSIPMTAYEFHKLDSKNLLNIGTAGGWTKASTGFTFNNTNKKVKQLVSFLKKEEDLTKFNRKNRFWYYDLILLDVLYKKNDLGAFIFPSLFKKNKTQAIFRFLGEQTRFVEELKIMFSITHWEFIKAFFRRLYLKLFL